MFGCFSFEKSDLLVETLHQMLIYPVGAPLLERLHVHKSGTRKCRRVVVADSHLPVAGSGRLSPGKARVGEPHVAPPFLLP